MTQDLMKLVDGYATQMMHSHYHPLMEARAAVVAALDALTKDAGRYQWLRNPATHQCVQAEVRIGVYRGMHWLARGLAEDSLDKTIDAAIAAQKGEQS